MLDKVLNKVENTSKPVITVMDCPHSLVRCGNKARSNRQTSYDSVVLTYDFVVLTKDTGVIRGLPIAGDQSKLVFDKIVTGVIRGLSMDCDPNEQ